MTIETEIINASVSLSSTSTLFGSFVWEVLLDGLALGLLALSYESQDHEHKIKCSVQHNGREHNPSHLPTIILFDISPYNTN
jgi:hypothetical protein